MVSIPGFYISFFTQFYFSKESRLVEYPVQSPGEVGEFFFLFSLFKISIQGDSRWFNVKKKMVYVIYIYYLSII